MRIYVSRLGICFGLALNRGTLGIDCGYEGILDVHVRAYEGMQGPRNLNRILERPISTTFRSVEA